jgi:hypothetical protein
VCGKDDFVSWQSSLPTAAPWRNHVFGKGSVIVHVILAKTIMESVRRTSAKLGGIIANVCLQSSPNPCVVHPRFQCKIRPNNG